ncbi:MULTISPECIES: glycosyltransferase family 32 protein [unclassified Paenibacillus]|uniref:glycosyltransferase family 32 protein n=1 Tax=unclassified Paenibacillus TaxID=185978 RepID=UPI003639517B
METPIPKIIHYCWFGRGKKPSQAYKCISSWRKHLPDYQIIEWNEDNFDVNVNLYCKQAYDAGKYAFVTDYVRLHVIYYHGGIYMDTDVEVLKSLDKFLDTSAFSGFESNEYIPTGIMGCAKGHPWVGRLLEFYKNHVFYKSNGSMDVTTNTSVITSITKDEYNLVIGNHMQILKDDVHIYPSDYFCPKNWMTGEMQLTYNSHVIHHFAGSWLPQKRRLRIKITGWIIRALKISMGKNNYFKFTKFIKNYL